MEAVEEGVLFGALYRIGVADRGGGDDKRRRPLVGFEGSSVRQLCEDEGEQQEGEVGAERQLVVLQQRATRR
jgi:hypothetical protein